MNKKKRTRTILYILGIIVVILVLISLFKSKDKRAVHVEISKAKKGTIIEKVISSGQIQPVIEVKISPEVSGEIVQLAVKENDSVAKGDFLLKIRPDNFESALERAQANLDQQMALLVQSKSNKIRAFANLTRARQEFKRQQTLFEQKVVSEADFQLAESNYKIAQQDHISATQSVKSSEYTIKSAKATLEEAEENLRLTSIKAPMSGIVSRLPVDVGETVLGTSQFQGTEVLRIADLSNMEVKVDVNENDIIRISVGDTTIIDVDAYSYMDKTFKGVVTYIANTANDKVSADAVTEFEVRVKILNQSYQDLILSEGIQYPFRPGMTASVDILTEIKKDILTVPLSAVTTRKAQKNTEDNQENVEELLIDEEVDEVVFILKEGIAVKTKVTTGISDFDNIEILEGINKGDEIVSGPFIAISKRLKDGDPLDVKNANK